MIANFSLQNPSYYVPRGIASIFAMGVVTALAALFFTHIIPLNSPLASLGCGIGFTCLNLFPIFYVGYLIYHKFTSSPEHHEQTTIDGLVPGDPTLWDQDWSPEQLAQEFRASVVAGNVSEVLHHLKDIPSSAILKAVLVPPGNLKPILALVTHTSRSDGRDTEIVRAIMKEVTKFGLIRDVMFFDDQQGKTPIVSCCCPNVDVFNIILDAIGKDDELLEEVLTCKCPETGNTLLHDAIAQETQRPNSEKGFTNRIVAEAQRMGILKSLLQHRNMDDLSILGYFGHYGAAAIEQIMSLLTYQELCEIVNDLDEDQIYLRGDSRMVSLKYKLFVYVFQKHRKRTEQLLAFASIDKGKLLHSALQIAQKYQQQDVIDDLTTRIALHQKSLPS